MIDLGVLSRAIEKKLGLEKEDAESIAWQVIAYFGFADIIVDNNIDKSDRKLFYMLQEAGFLNSTWETVTLYNSKNWRIYYWYFSEKKIRDCLVDREKKELDIYDTIPDEVWAMHSKTVLAN